jgi:hypothetical protein
MSDQIVKLRKVLATTQTGPGRRYSSELRRQIRAAATRRRAEGARWNVIAREIGIPHETVRRFSSERVRGTFVPVEVTATVVSGAGMAVVAPNGYRVEGIGVAEAAELLRRLS